VVPDHGEAFLGERRLLFEDVVEVLHPAEKETGYLSAA
jgi:hypothetical protein